ncbi:MAG: hypothetical protein QW727_00405 [Candidatus Pacearchaeota archaeon]
MGFFTKKNIEKKDLPQSEIPSLPELPSLPEIPKSNFSSLENKDKPYSLPSIPQSTLGEKINKGSIKEAVIQGSDNNLPQLKNEFKNAPPLQEPFPKYQKKDFHPRTIEISDWDNLNQKKIFSVEKQNFSQPLFIKLDTFEKTVSSFNEIKLKVSEIESLLRKIQEIKRNEEKELNQWEEEIEFIKARLEQINKEIFENI